MQSFYRDYLIFLLPIFCFAAGGDHSGGVHLDGSIENMGIILEDKDGGAVSNETLQSYTLKSNQTTNNGYELILYMVIPLNFKGIFYIVDGQGNDYNTNISNDFVCIGQNNELTIESTTMSYEEIDTDNSGSSIPSHYKLYKINLFNQYENYLIGTKDIEEGFTNLTGSQLFNNDTKLNKLLEIKTNCGSRYDCKGNTLFCADPIACNYDPVATVDDSSCIYNVNPSVDMTIGVWSWDWDDCAGTPGATYSLQFFSDNTVLFDGASTYLWSMCGDSLILDWGNNILS